MGPSFVFQLRQVTWPPPITRSKPVKMDWDELDRRVKAQQPTSAQHLWELLQNCWKTIPGDYFLTLIDGVPKLCKAVTKAKGGYSEE